MSSFHELGDEFAGDEANEEWDAAWAAYTSGGDTSQVSDAPLRAALRLPGARVELRGEVDEAIVALFADLHAPLSSSDDSLGIDAQVPLVTFTVRSVAADTDLSGDRPPTAWRVEQDAEGVCAEGEGPVDLARALVARIVPAASSADETHLHLDAACVDLDGTGVLLLGGTRERRDAVLYEFLAEGAHYLTNDDTVLQPGTRAASGTAMPLWRRDGQLLAASHSVPIAEHCDIGVLLVLSDSDVRAPGAVTSDHTIVELLASVVGSTASHGAAMDQLAVLVTGSTCTRVDPRDPAACVAAARTSRRPERRRLATSFEWVTTTPDPAAEGGRRGRRAEPIRVVHRMVRFDDGATVDHGDGVGAIVVTAEQADALEAQVVAAHSLRPGPEALGLPNCPVGTTARALWSTSMLLGTPDGAVTLPSGVVAELVSRELLKSDGPLRDRVIERHLAASALTDAAVERFVEIADIAASAGIVPIVVGALAQAFDGPLPEHFTDVGRVDLLVRKDQVDLFAEQLEQRGYTSESRLRSGSSLATTPDRRLHHSDRPSILIDLHCTLAAGPFGELVDPEEFHHCAVPVRIGTRWAAALHPEHRFVHECVRADRSEHTASIAELRDVVLSAPRSASLMPATMECSARWGATSSVVSVARRIAPVLPGLPGWLVQVAGGDSGGPRRREGLRGRRTRR